MAEASEALASTAPRTLSRRNWGGEVRMFGFILTETGIRPEDPLNPPSEQNYGYLGDYLTWMETAIQWLIGDFVAFGEATYGERAAQVVDSTNFKIDSVRQAAWVSQRIAPADRRPNLSWSHHRVVAGLEPDAQRLALAQAESQSLSVAGLRAVVRNDTTCWLVVKCDNAEDRTTLARRLESEGRTTKEQ